MDSVTMIVLALGVGALAGAAIASLIWLAQRQGETAAELSSWELPKGVTDLLDALEIPAVIVDPSRNVMAASDSAVTMGLIANGRLVTPELVDMVDDLRYTGEADVSKELEVSRGPFGDATMILSARAIRFGVRFTLVIAADKTEFRRLEEVRRDFVANISHELKTPIGAVGLLSEALTEAADDPVLVRKFADRLRGEAARLADLVQEIIELSRLQAEAALSELEPVEIDKVIFQAVDRNRVVAKAKNVDIKVGGEKNVIVFGNEASLVVALGNLVSNAVNYSPNDSHVGIGVSVKDSHVEIAITDKGIGMSAEDSERIFERFYRTDDARSRTTGGTGLGLSIVKHTINNHGGDIRVWSKLGQGSTFTVRIPIAGEFQPEKDEDE
jgi:two-component system sensor histidine kinase SenX3